MTRRKDPRPEGVSPEVPGGEPEASGTPAIETAPVAPFVEEGALPDPPDPSEPPAPAPDLRPPPQPVPSRPGIFGPLLGGALAAIGGFALSHFDVLGFAPDQVADPALTAQLEQAGKDQAALSGRFDTEVSALSDRIGRLETAPAPAAPDPARLDALDQRLAAIEALPADGTATTAALSAKLADLERRLASLSQGGDPALQQKLDDALARLAEAEAAATARAGESETAARAATRSAALDSLATAIASGEPFVAELQVVADPALTAALGPSAETGVPSLSRLKSGFPDAAREALRLARDLDGGEGWGGRLLDFLAAQTEARPLTPQEGNAPGAILSRAEFALAEGRVADALAELQPLDPAVKPPLEPWIAEAEAHLAAMAALTAARGK